MIKDTIFSLELRVQHIDEKISSLAPDRLDLLGSSNIDLNDEKAVTEQCIRICQGASFYIRSLQEQESTLQKEADQQSAEYVLKQFEAQLITQNTLKESRSNILQTVNVLQQRLHSMNSDSGPRDNAEMLKLQEEIKISKECLEVCQQASNEVSAQKIHIIGEVIADDDTDQVVVTTVADLFKVDKVKAKNRSAQLVGSTTGDVLRDLSKDRYNSRFGAVKSFDKVQSVPPAAISSTSKISNADKCPVKSSDAKDDGRSAGPETTYERPSPNEVRRRRAEGEDGKAGRL